MHRYRNRNPDSPIRFYAIGRDYIDVAYADGGRYRYSYKRPGPFAVERMKELARSGEGLSTFISQHVRTNYERKF